MAHMHDPNIENTLPTPRRDEESTQPVRVSRPDLEDTLPGIPPYSDPKLEDTAPIKVPPPVQKPRRWPFILGGFLLILLLGGLGAFIGYKMASAQRSAVSAEQLAQITTEQFMLGVQEMQSGKLSNALKRFEYVISLDPNFPGARDKLTEVMMAMALTSTPRPSTPEPTPTPSPTPDLRGEEDIFNNARALLAQKEWFQVMDVLTTLRDKNPTFRAVQVDGMMYVALRNRGLAKINQGNLESGLYDLALVERFAPLDNEANGVRTWARLYLTGASWWDVNWEKVLSYFEQIYPYYPSMMDSSGTTAQERYFLASVKYGDKLMAESKACDALNRYRNAANIRTNEELDNKINEADKICNPPAPTGTTTSTPTTTPTLLVTTPPVVETTTTPLPPTETPTPPTP